MIEFLETSPDTAVQQAEYNRLLGFPRERELEGRARELVEHARAWYAGHGHPWIYARGMDSLRLDGDTVFLDAGPFTSPRLAAMLRQSGAQTAVVVAVSAGPELEAEAARRWQDDRPDEYFFLEVFGSALAEHLVMVAGARLCDWADGRGLAVLPHYSPGYPDWDIGEQPRLLELIGRSAGRDWPSPLEVLDSGMLRPKKALLAVFGLTRETARVGRLTELVPCENCSLAGCRYRRARYTGASGYGTREFDLEPAAPTLDPQAAYQVNARALRRWAAERLTLIDQPDGTVHATFRYDGTTCSNTGRALSFIYTVRLGPRAEGYPIRAQHCEPAPGDEGHRFMCRYVSNAAELMRAIEREKPLLGRPLNDVLGWRRPTIAPGCYCRGASRRHKWGLVLETIHYALARRQDSRDPVVAADTGNAR
jgi:hypothetical protein